MFKQSRHKWIKNWNFKSIKLSCSLKSENVEIQNYFKCRYFDRRPIFVVVKRSVFATWRFHNFFTTTSRDSPMQVRIFRNPILGFLMKWPINFSFMFNNVYYSNLETLSCDVKIGNLPLVKWSPPGCLLQKKRKRDFI